jgi:hypothetical protein
VTLHKPTAGGRIRLSPTADGHYTSQHLPLEDPLDGATDAEREFYLANYQGVPLAELLRRLRTAEGDAAYRQEEIARLQEQARRMPPLYAIHEMDARHKRIRALLDVPRRGGIPKAELLAALRDPLEYPIQPAQADEA